MAMFEARVDEIDPAVIDAAAAKLDEQYKLVDLAASKIGDTAPTRSNPVNDISLKVLRRRCMEVSASGSVNIAVSVDLLVELMNASLYAIKNGYVSNLTV